MKDKIIQFIRESKVPISGEDISRHLNISRAAIWKYIQELRKEGYHIKAAPNVGYSLESVPDKLIPIEIRNNLNTKIFGRKIISFDSVDTTMDIAFKLGVDGAKEGTVVCTETQKKGKGRLGRKWVSPKGKGLYFSIILRPNLHPSEISRLTLFSAVAICSALRKVSGVDIKIKWPNDLLVKNKKIAGILTELSAEMDSVRFVVVGVGINVNTALKSLPEVGTSLLKETNEHFSRIEVLQEILRESEKWYGILREEGFNPIIKKWKELSSTLGRRVKFIEMSKEMEGVAVDLKENGALMIKDDKGDIYSKMSGDVEY